MKKSVKYFVVGLLIISIMVGILIVNAAVTKTGSVKWHPASDIKLRIDSTDTDLQAKLEDTINNPLKNLPLTSSQLFPTSGHNASEVWLTIRTGGISGTAIEMSLQTALGTSNLCGKDLTVSSYSSASIPKKAMLATEIEFLDGRSLQEAINVGDVLYTNNSYSLNRCTNNDQYTDQYDSCDRIKKTDMTACGTSGYTSNHYCKSGDVVRNYTTRGCSSGSCTSSTSANKVKECSSGTCSSGDCYGAWSNGVNCGSFPQDDCPESNEQDPYTCGSSASTTCSKDVDLTGATSLNPGCAGIFFNFRVRTVNCYTP